MRTKYTTENISYLIADYLNKNITAINTNIYIDNKEVISLLFSISKGYPIKSIVLNKSDNNTVILGETIFIALLRCFCRPSILFDTSNFNIYYDLIQKEFIVTEKPNGTQIAPYSLISTRDYFDWQIKMSNRQNFQAISNEYYSMGDSLSKYNIPIIELIEASEKDIQNIKRNNLFL